MSSAANHITPANALIKARNYCAYQERCYYEVETKLKEWGLNYGFWGHICVKLSEEGYLSESRYVSAYVRGKFNGNHWGRLKIINGLKSKRISAKMMEEGLSHITDEMYKDMITKLLTKKSAALKESNPFKKRQKLVSFLHQKGFESDVVYSILDEMEND